MVRKTIAEFLEQHGYRLADLARDGIIAKYNEIKLKEAGFDRPIQVMTQNVTTPKQKHTCFVCGKETEEPKLQNGTYYCKEHYNIALEKMRAEMSSR